MVLPVSCNDKKMTKIVYYILFLSPKSNSVFQKYVVIDLFLKIKIHL